MDDAAAILEVQARGVDRLDDIVMEIAAHTLAFLHRAAQLLLILAHLLLE